MLSTDYALTEATRAKLERLNRPELVQMCETRELEVGGTKAQLAQSLIEWVCHFAEVTISPCL